MRYITFENVTKEYHTTGENILASNQVYFEIEKGDLYVVLGPSGALDSQTDQIQNEALNDSPIPVEAIAW